MRNKTVCWLGLACLVLVLKGDSCLVEERTVDVVVTGDIPATWHTEGSNSEGSASIMIDANDEVLEALDDLSDEAELESIKVSGVCYEVLENDGFIGSHSGVVSVDGHALLEFDVPTNAVGTTGGTEGAEVTLVADGVGYVNGLMATYLAGYNAGNPDEDLLDDLMFSASWESADPGASSYDFDWKTCLILQVVGNVTLDVPNP
jgi:hypothetical protein